MSDPRSGSKGRRSGTTRAPLIVAVLACLSIAAAAPVLAEPPPMEASATEGEATSEEGPLESRRLAIGLAAQEERSRVLLDLVLEAARSYRKVAVERSAAQQDLSESLERLDREAVRPRDLTRERLELLTQEVERARLHLVQLLDASSRRLDELLRLVSERDHVARRIADLRARLPQAHEPLSGAWVVNWLPNGVSGTFYLEQTGTLVTGQYKLGPLGSGSLQGTFAGGKLYLQRIDAQKGRDCELEGVLDADGSRIRGTWQNYEMVQGGTPRGQWVAKRAQQ